MSLARYILYRFFLMIPTLLIITFIVFSLIHFIPGDPIRAIAGINASPEDIERIKREMGWYDPIHVQYFRWLSKVVTGDLGKSIRTGYEVSEIIARTLPNTLELAVLSMAFALSMGIPVGIYAAYKRGSPIDRAIILLSLTGSSFPQFLIGLVLIYVVSVELNLLPSAGKQGPIYTLEGFKSALMPALTLSLYSAGIIARITRSSTAKVFSELYTLYAQAKGLPRRTVIFRHVLRNSLIPVISIAGIQFGFLMGGAVIVETIFAWPGIGRQLVDAIISRDYILVQGIVLVYTVLFMVLNLIVDISYKILDPRVELK